MAPIIDQARLSIGQVTGTEPPKEDLTSFSLKHTHKEYTYQPDGSAIVQSDTYKKSYNWSSSSEGEGEGEGEGEEGEREGQGEGEREGEGEGGEGGAQEQRSGTEEPSLQELAKSGSVQAGQETSQNDFFSLSL